MLLFSPIGGKGVEKVEPARAAPPFLPVQSCLILASDHLWDQAALPPCTAVLYQFSFPVLRAPALPSPAGVAHLSARLCYNSFAFTFALPPARLCCKRSRSAKGAGTFSLITSLGAGPKKGEMMRVTAGGQAGRAEEKRDLRAAAGGTEGETLRATAGGQVGRAEEKRDLRAAAGTEERRDPAHHGRWLGEFACHWRSGQRWPRSRGQVYWAKL
ncbi:uncharacterized protein LOC115095986 [Rhinatrema bivittatum]|uniref:uncharacterized protein LOC115095986 n=1 Tax=Rhinatrema bivittatum TaxID=194408 RepID=UPI00112E9FEE|nr:uncharacterized protein LOC115095986 [Rhinatrema bivittatum]